MPQLDFSTFLSQIFWLTLLFGALYFVVANYISPTIFAIREQRDLKVSQDIASANFSKAKTSDLMELIEEESAKITLASAKLFEEAQGDFKKQEEEKQRELHQKIQSLLHATEEDLLKLRQEFEANLQQLSIQHAKYIIEQVSGFKPSEKDLLNYYKKVRS